MGRNRKNKFEESSIGFEWETEFDLNHVKVPFLVNVTYKVPITEDKKFYGTTTVLVKSDISEKNEIIEKFQKDSDKEVLNIEPFTIPFSDLCPECDRKGIPKVEPKNNKFDYHYKVGTRFSKTEVNKPNEYWLCYDHKTKPYKCRVAKWDKNRIVFTKHGKIYNKLRKYIFHEYVRWKQGELDAFDSFNKFINTSHA